jgi:ribosome-associated protein
MIAVTRSIQLNEAEIVVDFVRSTGPGGQNVNKVSTSAQLRFDAAASPSFNDEVRQRVIALAGKRATKDGVIIIQASRYRTQERNRADAVDRLIDLIRRASVKPRTRKATRPTRASNARRRDSKERRSKTKRTRRPVSGDE